MKHYKVTFRRIETVDSYAYVHVMARNEEKARAKAEDISAEGNLSFKEFYKDICEEAIEEIEEIV